MVSPALLSRSSLSACSLSGRTRAVSRSCTPTGHRQQLVVAEVATGLDLPCVGQLRVGLVVCRGVSFSFSFICRSGAGAARTGRRNREVGGGRGACTGRDEITWMRADGRACGERTRSGLARGAPGASVGTGTAILAPRLRRAKKPAWLRPSPWPAGAGLRRPAGSSRPPLSSRRVPPPASSQPAGGRSSERRAWPARALRRRLLGHGLLARDRLLDGGAFFLAGDLPLAGRPLGLRLSSRPGVRAGCGGLLCCLLDDWFLHGFSSQRRRDLLSQGASRRARPFLTAADCSHAPAGAGPSQSARQRLDRGGRSGRLDLTPGTAPGPA